MVGRNPRRGDALDIRAQDWRRVLRMVDQWETIQAASSQLLDFNSGPAQRPIINNTGGDLPAGSVVAKASALDFTNEEDETKTQLALRCNTPDADTSDDFDYLITLEPIQDGGAGRAATSGIVFARVDIQTSGDGFANVVDGSTDLESTDASGKFKIIQAESTGTGVKSCIVRFNTSQMQIVKRGKTDAGILSGNSGTVSIYRSAIDSGDNVTAHLLWAHGGQQVSADKEVFVAWFEDENKWIIIGAECED